MKTRSFGHAVTVFLGDYINRGRGPMRMIEQLASAESPTSVIAWQAITRIFSWRS
jgi:hypothetical protein